MILQKEIKTIHGLSYYTGSHPKIRLLNKKNSRPTEFGNKVWDTSLVFIDFLSQRNFNLNEKSVLEIGSGWGLLGLFLTKYFGCKVTCTDLDEKVLPIVQTQAELNQLTIKTEHKSFNQILDEDLKNINVLVGAEVCYSEKAASDLNQLIIRACKVNVQQIFIADPGRPDFLDLICNNTSIYNKKIYYLPGTKNGKVTNVLRLSKPNTF